MIASGGTATLGLYDLKRQIDAFGGVDYFRQNLAGRYLKNARVMLANGDIVKSTVDGNTSDPNVNMTGWVNVNDASQIVDASGMTQQQINDLAEKWHPINVEKFRQAGFSDTQKPEEIMRQICKICLPGGRILDPFAGSGSTLAAAELEGYDSVGVELSEEIAKSAAERLGVEVKRQELSK